MKGWLNAKNCAAYLRDIGVDLSEAMVASWVDAEMAHRLVSDMDKVVAQGWDWYCDNGHHVYIVVERKRGRSNVGTRRDTRCPDCGERYVRGFSRWARHRDGRITDSRHRSERWKPLDDPSDPGLQEPTP